MNHGQHIPSNIRGTCDMWLPVNMPLSTQTSPIQGLLGLSRCPHVRRHSDAQQSHAQGAGLTRLFPILRLEEHLGACRGSNHPSPSSRGMAAPKQIPNLAAPAQPMCTGARSVFGGAGQATCTLGQLALFPLPPHSFLKSQQIISGM
jgi:hypothetical protein